MNPHDELRISWPFRLVLTAKALLLAALAAVFALIVVRLWLVGGGHGIVLGVVTLIAAPLALFLGWAASLGLLDALVGQALRSEDAVALRHRRSGHSLRLPNGRFVEFILWNPWLPLQAERRYRVIYGRFSGVLVRAPELQEPS